jgi:hypothetical protein
VSPPPPTLPTHSGVCGAVARPARRSRTGLGRTRGACGRGQATPFHCLEELLAFISRVLTDVQTPS